MNIREQIEKDAGIRGEEYQNFNGQKMVISKKKLRNKLLSNGWMVCPNRTYIRKGDFYLHDNSLFKHYHTELQEAK